MVALYARAGGFTVFGVEKNQIDVGRNIEFAAAELAHADNVQLLRLAGFSHRRAQALRKITCHPFERSG